MDEQMFNIDQDCLNTLCVMKERGEKIKKKKKKKKKTHVSPAPKPDICNLRSFQSSSQGDRWKDKRCRFGWCELVFICRSTMILCQFHLSYLLRNDRGSMWMALGQKTYLVLLFLVYSSIYGSLDAFFFFS